MAVVALNSVGLFVTAADVAATFAASAVLDSGLQLSIEQHGLASVVAVYRTSHMRVEPEEDFAGATASGHQVRGVNHG